MREQSVTLEQAKTIAFALKAHSSLQELDLRSNRFAPGGIEEILMALSSNKKMTHLNLASIDIDPDSRKSFINALCKLVKENTTLVSLNLDNAYIYADDLHLLAEALEQNTTLKTVSLREVYLKEKDTDRLLKMLDTNKTLTGLYIPNSSTENNEALRWQFAKKLAATERRSPQLSMSTHSLLAAPQPLSLQPASANSEGAVFR